MSENPEITIECNPGNYYGKQAFGNIRKVELTV